MAPRCRERASSTTSVATNAPQHDWYKKKDRRLRQSFQILITYFSSDSSRCYAAGSPFIGRRSISETGRSILLTRRLRCLPIYVNFRIGPSGRIDVYNFAHTHSGDLNNGGHVMTKLVPRFLKDISGATAIEYGLIAAGISVAIIAVVNGLGTQLNAKFGSISSQLH